MREVKERLTGEPGRRIRRQRGEFRRGRFRGKERKSSRSWSLGLNLVKDMFWYLSCRRLFFWLCLLLLASPLFQLQIHGRERDRSVGYFWDNSICPFLSSRVWFNSYESLVGVMKSKKKNKTTFFCSKKKSFVLCSQFLYLSFFCREWERTEKGERGFY